MLRHLPDLILESYPVIAKALVAPFIELLTISRDLFAGDIDCALIFYAIAIRTIEHEDYKKLSVHEINNGSLSVPPSLRTNARSISESLGIPRESVRRKVQWLIDGGLVLRSGNDLMATGQGLARIAPVRGCLVGMSIRYFQLVSSIVAQAEQSNPGVRGKAAAPPP